MLLFFTMSNVVVQLFGQQPTRLSTSGGSCSLLAIGGPSVVLYIGVGDKFFCSAKCQNLREIVRRKEASRGREEEVGSGSRSHTNFATS